MNIIITILSLLVGIHLSGYTPLFDITMMQAIVLGPVLGIVGFICILIYAGIKG